MATNNIAIPQDSVSQQLSQAVISKIKIPRKFEIFVEEYTEGDVGCPAGWRPLKIDPTLGGNGSNPVITVSSQAELAEQQSMYKMAGQRFRVLREIDPPSQADLKAAAIAQGLIEDPSNSSSHDEQKNVNDVIKESVQQPANTSPSYANTKMAAIQPTSYIQNKPKVITIGDMQIKYDGDKVYQKQWIRLSATEASNFRVVSDSSNKMIPMTGKHIEAKRWVLVENSSEDDNTEELINA